jgi:hypothetical protein
MSSDLGYGANEATNVPITHISNPLTVEEMAGLGPTLSPPAMLRTLSASPGANSEFSNEASGGHNVGQHAGGGGNLSFLAQQMQAQNTLNSSLSSSTVNARVTRGGFDNDQDHLETPTALGQSTDSAEPGSDPAYQPRYDRGNSNTSVSGPSMASGSTNMIGESQNGYSTQTYPSTFPSVGNFSQLTATSSTGAMEDVIPTTFDEATLRALCDMEVSLLRPLLPSDTY